MFNICICILFGVAVHFHTQHAANHLRTGTNAQHWQMFFQGLGNTIQICGGSRFVFCRGIWCGIAIKLLRGWKSAARQNQAVDSVHLLGAGGVGQKTDVYAGL